MPKSGNLRIEYFGPFGWTTSAKVAQWFSKNFDKYIEDNKLKYRAMETFHGKGEHRYNVCQVAGKWFNKHQEISLDSGK